VTCAVVVAALALALGLAAPARADDALTVIGGSNPAAFFEVLDDVAELGGFFKAEHLTVTKQYAGTASTCAQLVASGKGDVCSLSVEPILQGYEKGLRLQFFFGRDPRYDYVLGVLDDSPIRTLADFKGKVLGEISAGSAVEPVVLSMLQGAGLKKSDYTFVPIGTGAQGMAAFTGRRVDAAAFPSVELQTYHAWTNVKIRYFEHPILKDIGNVGYAATPATIASKADALKRYCRALVKAALLVRENTTLAARYFLQGAGLKVTPDAVAQEARVLDASQADLAGADPGNKRIGYMPPNGIAVYSRFLNDNGVTSQAAPAESVVTNQFIDYANDFDHRAIIAEAKAMR